LTDKPNILPVCPLLVLLGTFGAEDVLNESTVTSLGPLAIGKKFNDSVFFRCFSVFEDFEK
jgi:hypothetical protein